MWQLATEVMFPANVHQPHERGRSVETEKNQLCVLAAVQKLLSLY